MNDKKKNDKKKNVCEVDTTIYEFQSVVLFSKLAKLKVVESRNAILGQE